MTFERRLVEGKDTDWALIPKHAPKRNDNGKVTLAGWQSGLVKDIPVYENENIVASVECSEEKTQKLYGYKWEEFRFIPSYNQMIDNFVPPKEDIEEPAFDDDTLLIQTEESTFIPPLTTAPMPSAVIDELRGKYSKFRDRHDDEYVASRAAVLAEKEEAMVENERKMRSPLHELKEKARELGKKEIEKRETINDDVMVKIGEAMARNLKLNEDKIRARVAAWEERSQNKAERSATAA
jgi:gas vesicle protein